ncbi:MAG: hypothetical protein R3362_10495 [Rhodothermales bacterium]|nr:hypothetical protein [Rhodothermales bacterium]
MVENRQPAALPLTLRELKLMEARALRDLAARLGTEDDASERCAASIQRYLGPSASALLKAARAADAPAHLAGS